MLNLRGLSCSLSMCGSLSLSSDVGDKWMHPEGINWIWEQSPAQSTRTDKHPPSLPSPSLPPFGTHTQTHASFIPVMPCRNVCHPPLSPSHHPTLMDQSVSPYPSHTHTHTHGRVPYCSPVDCNLSLGYSVSMAATFFARAEWDGVSERGGDHSYRFTGCLLIHCLQLHTYLRQTPPWAAHMFTHAHAQTGCKHQIGDFGEPAVS